MPRVLLIDDDTSLLDVLALAFEDAAHEVHRDDVERVVEVEHDLQAERPEADEPGREADEHRAQRTDEARGGRDRDEAGDGTGHEAQRRRLPVDEALGDDPRRRGRGRGDLRREERVARGGVSSER